MTITDIISQIREDWLADDVSNEFEFSTGLCADFANAVAAKAGQAGILVNIVSDEDTHLVPPIGVSNQVFQDDIVPGLAHTWIEFNGVHYDAEAPNGVDNPVELPVIMRASVEILTDKHSGILSNLIDSHQVWKNAKVNSDEFFRWYEKFLSQQNSGMSP